MNASSVLLVLETDPALEMALGDWLISLPGTESFTCVRLAEHSRDHRHWPVTDRIAGHRPRLRIHLHGSRAAVDAVLEALRSEFPQADFLWWVLPVLAAGRLPVSD